MGPCIDFPTQLAAEVLGHLLSRNPPEVRASSELPELRLQWGGSKTRHTEGTNEVPKPRRLLLPEEPCWWLREYEMAAMQKDPDSPGCLALARSTELGKLGCTSPSTGTWFHAFSRMAGSALSRPPVGPDASPSQDSTLAIPGSTLLSI